MHRSKGRTTGLAVAGGVGKLSVADIAAQPGGIEALQRRVHELRSSGIDFAANAIEQEMAAFDLPRS
ncbi:hypothetical protein [Nocardia sp. XZ_19_385]|uniref:hypothetical protein n=1 Tax=Nocardia sp. XZ_19_385 TaxID=2769488 RepID=UPI001E50EEA9|nr:hypothetical protein [Nocardia sp. XZ_19_385]